ncbi:MAG: hypothetical protein ACRD4X_13645 [Candidatus Acidiferrales bacterium]
MNSFLAAPILPTEFVSRTSADIFSIVAVALSAILFVAVLLILFRRVSANQPLESKSRNDSFNEGEKK